METTAPRTLGRWRLYTLEHTKGALVSNPEKCYIHIDSGDYAGEFRMSGFMKPADAAIVRCAPESYELAELIVREYESVDNIEVPRFVVAARELLRRMRDTEIPTQSNYFDRPTE